MNFTRGFSVAQNQSINNIEISEMSVASWYKNPPANHSHHSSVPSAKTVPMRLNNTREQETWVTILAEELAPGFCTRIHYPAAVDTTPVVGRWTWIQHKLLIHWILCLQDNQQNQIMPNVTTQYLSVNENSTNRNDPIFKCRRTFRYSHFVTTYLINSKHERREMCSYLRTNYHSTSLQTITTKSTFMPILKSTIQKQIVM